MNERPPATAGIVLLLRTAAATDRRGLIVSLTAAQPADGAAAQATPASSPLASLNG